MDEDTDSSSIVTINADEPTPKSENEIDERSISVKSVMIISNDFSIR